MKNTYVELNFPVTEEHVINEAPEPEPKHEVPRRPERDRRPPNYYGKWATPPKKLC